MLLDDDTQSAEPRPRWMKVLMTVGGVTLAGGLGAAMLYGVLKSSDPVKKKSVQEISLLRPPPPPPPPKVEEKPPEPEMKKEEVKLPEEQPDPEPQQSDQAPPGPDLGVDSAATGSGDGFGLRAKPGGQDITTIGGGDAHRIYASALRTQIQKALARNERLRGANFTVSVRVWVEPGGGLGKVELMDTSGDREKDRRIQLALAEVPALKDSPPEGLPQPIRFRLSSTF